MFDVFTLQWTMVSRVIEASSNRYSPSSSDLADSSLAARISDREFYVRPLPGVMGHCSAVLGHLAVVYGGTTTADTGHAHSGHAHQGPAVLLVDLTSHVWIRAKVVNSPRCPRVSALCTLTTLDHQHCLLTGGKGHQFRNQVWLLRVHVTSFSVTWRRVDISSPGYDISKAGCCVVGRGDVGVGHGREGTW